MDIVVKNEEGTAYIVNPAYLDNIMGDSTDSHQDEAIDSAEDFLTFLNSFRKVALADSFIDAVNHSVECKELTEGEAANVVKVFNEQGGEAALEYVQKNHPQLLDGSSDGSSGQSDDDHVQDRIRAVAGN